VSGHARGPPRVAISPARGTCDRLCSRVVRRSAITGLVFVLALAPSLARANEIQVCFSPPLPQGCDPTQTVIQALDSAQHQILVQAFSFTSAPIATAIVDARKRGVDVRVILDKSNVRRGYSSAKFLEHANVPVLIDAQHAIAHNKVMIIDGQTVITGSFNFTKAAEQDNAENLVLIHNSALAEQYVQNWNIHAAHAQPLSKVSERVSRSGLDDDADGDDRPPTPSGPIVGNRRSLVYAWPGCESYDTMAPQNRVVFPSRQAAEVAGYRQAGNCP
jgi:phosphatidylserine/phosphatidylglycerophosphate/cardiolipin synthase-like enzyme